MFLGATCTGFGASPAACVGAGQRYTAHADQAGNTQGSKQFFQILFVHGSLPQKFGLMDIERINQHLNEDGFVKRLRARLASAEEGGVPLVRRSDEG